MNKLKLKFFQWLEYKAYLLHERIEERSHQLYSEVYPPKPLTERELLWYKQLLELAAKSPWEDMMKPAPFPTNMGDTIRTMTFERPPVVQQAIKAIVRAEAKRADPPLTEEEQAILCAKLNGVPDGNKARIILMEFMNSRPKCNHACGLVNGHCIDCDTYPPAPI